MVLALHQWVPRKLVLFLFPFLSSVILPEASPIKHDDGVVAALQEIRIITSVAIFLATFLIQIP